MTSENTLGNQRWFEPVVWILQIMPLFFVTGGITGLQSWRRLRAGGGSATDFIRGRMLRLIRPASVLLPVLFAGLWVARQAGVDGQVIQLLAAGAGVPLWFLAAYWWSRPLVLLAVVVLLLAAGPGPIRQARGASDVAPSVPCEPGRGGNGRRRRAPSHR